MPIQIGRNRSASFSFRITTCWPLGMCTRMLSTCISMNFDMPLPILTSEFLATTCDLQWVGDRAKRTRAPSPDRRPRARLPGVFCPALPDRPGWPDGQRGLRLYVDVALGPAAASGLRAGVVRPGRRHLPAPGARPVQGHPAANAPGTQPADPVGSGHREGLRDPDL